MINESNRKKAGSSERGVINLQKVFCKKVVLCPFRETPAGGESDHIRQTRH